MVQSLQTVLFVLTSTKTMGAAGKLTGAWLEEFTVPYYAIRDGGLLADIATTAGGPRRSIRAAPKRARRRSPRTGASAPIQNFRPRSRRHRQ